MDAHNPNKCVQNAISLERSSLDLSICPPPSSGEPSGPWTAAIGLAINSCSLSLLSSSLSGSCVHGFLQSDVTEVLSHKSAGNLQGSLN